jgi:PadR family transcriptional regulator PadR
MTMRRTIGDRTPGMLLLHRKMGGHASALTLECLGMPSEIVKGNVGLLLLAVVSGEPLHGYAICEELRARSGGVLDLPEGTIYPALHRLENEGLLTSSWAKVDGRRRRVYNLSARGRRSMVNQRAQWQRHVAAVSAILEGVAWPTPA